MEVLNINRYDKIHCKLKTLLRTDPTACGDLKHDYNSEYTALLGIIAMGDIDLVKSVFPRFINTNAELKYENLTMTKILTPVFIGLEYSSRGHIYRHILNYLLDSGADLNQKYKYIKQMDSSKGTTELSIMEFAFYVGCPETVELLLDKGADLLNSEFALKCSCFHHNIDLLKLVLKSKISFHEEDHLPIHWALFSHFKTEGHLDVWDTNVDMHTISVIGLEEYMSDISQRITCFGDFDIQNRSHVPVFEDYEENQVKCLQFLLDHGADPNKAERTYHLSPGHVVNNGNKAKIFKLLLYYRWNINARDRKGWTALHYAVLSNNPTIVKLLLDNGADVHAETVVGGQLPIHVNVFEYLAPLDYRPLSEWFVKYNQSKIECIEHFIEEGVSLDNPRKGRDSLIDSHSGRSMFYVFTQWLVRRTEELPQIILIPMDIHAMNNQQDSYDWALNLKEFLCTDCLINAGYRNKGFIEAHLILFILANHLENFLVAIHADPYAIYKVELVSLIDYIDEIGTFCIDGNDTDKTLLSDILYPMIRDPKKYDLSVYTLAEECQKKPPSLLQLTIYTVRCILTRCNKRNSLYHLMKFLNIPNVLKLHITLNNF